MENRASPALELFHRFDQSSHLIRRPEHGSVISNLERLRKLADFIVIDRDVLTVPSDQLKDIQVLETYVGGEQVYKGKKSQ